MENIIDSSVDSSVKISIQTVSENNNKESVDKNQNNFSSTDLTGLSNFGNLVNYVIPKQS